MSSGSIRPNAKQQERSAPEVRLPVWAVPIVRASDALYPYLLGIALLLFALIHALLFVGQTKFTWLPQVASFLGFFLSIGYLTFVVAGYAAVVAGWVGVIIGVGLRFGSPFLLSFLATKGHVPDSDPFLALIFKTIPNMGLMLLAVGLLDLAIVYTVKFITHRQQTESQRFKYLQDDAKEAQKRSLIPKCWQMSRCRPGVRLSCPNYVDHVTCWKRRSGCFCDRNLANYLLQTSGRNESDEVTEMQRLTGKTSMTAVRGQMQNAKRRPWKLQKTLCHSCPLFVEHQEYKYKNLHWISFPITIGLVTVLFDFFHQGYIFLAGYLDQFMKLLVTRGGLPENFNPDASTLVDSPFEYILLAVVTLLLASYVIAVTEKVFVEWKL